MKNVSQKFEALKSMPNNKSPGNDGLTEEYFEIFWSEFKKAIFIMYSTLFW